MKLEYSTHTFHSFINKNADVTVTTYCRPVSTITNFTEAQEFFHSLFVKPSWVKEIEFVDIGKKTIIRASFYRGPFNERPIKFSVESDYSKTFKTHHVLNCVLGALAENPNYFIRVIDGEIKVDKMIECMG